MSQYSYTLQDDYSFAGGIPAKPFPIHPSMEGKLDPAYVQFYHDVLSNNEAICYTHRNPLAKIRAGGNVIPGQAPAAEMAKVFDTVIDRKYTQGAEIPVRVFVPPGEPGPDGWPLFIWYHGGGWTLGSISTENNYCTQVAAGAKCVVMTVDYRLAPEHPFPACVDDAFESLIYGLERAPAALGTNASKVALGGSSAGGNLTAVATHQYAQSDHSKRLPPVVFQCQVVPVTDNTATPETMPLWKENEFTTQLPAEKMLWYRRLYLPRAEDAGAPELSPLNYSDDSFANLPPAFIAASECDVLRSEAEAYAAKLKKNGVDTELKIYKGMPHTTMVMDGVMEKGKELVQDTVKAIRDSFEQ